MWRYRESDRGAGQICFMSCDQPYYAAIDWQVAAIDRSIAIDVLSTPVLHGEFMHHLLMGRAMKTSMWSTEWRSERTSSESIL